MSNVLQQKVFGWTELSPYACNMTTVAATVHRTDHDTGEAIEGDGLPVGGRWFVSFACAKREMLRCLRATRNDYNDAIKHVSSLTQDSCE